MFAGRNLLIATKHGKERVIAPILEKSLGVICKVPADFNTDTLGTFTGEIERILDPLSAAREKCLRAMEIENCDLAIASEGSFGPHPSIFFVSCDDEILLFLDKKNNLEIVARNLSTETNFYGSDINNQNDLKNFAEKSSFPSHGLIARKSKDDNSAILKNINSWEKLNEVFIDYRDRFGSLYLETDMRAMANPSRMSVIEQTALKLVEKINSTCPNCNTPGFSVMDSKTGLPCEMCYQPTRSTLYYIHSCKKCTHTFEEKYPNDKQMEDPMYCDFCNP